MTFLLTQLKKETLGELKKRLMKEMDDGNTPDEIYFKEHIEGVIGFLYALKTKNKIILKILKDLSIIKAEKDNFSTFEKGISTIAKLDQTNKIMHPDKAKKKKWMTTKLSTYLSYMLPETDENTGSIIAKKVYDKHKNMLVCKLKRVNASPKVLELAQKYPDIDINRLVSLGVVNNKLELTNDDLLWLDQMISIIKSKK
jgi:hypothetical protein